MRPSPGRVAALVGAAGLVGTVGLSGTALAVGLEVGGAATAITAPSITDRPVDLRLLDQGFAIAGGDDFTATFALEGPDVDVDTVITALGAPSPEPSDVVVAVTAHDPLEERAEFDAIDGDGPAGTDDRVELVGADVLAVIGDAVTGDVEVPVVDESAATAAAAADDADKTVMTEADDPADSADPADVLRLRGPGIYPVTIELSIHGQVVAATVTFVQLYDPEGIASPLAVSIVAGVADPGPWPSSTETESGSIEAAKLIDLAAAVDGPLSISLPPVLVRHLSPPAAGDNAGDVTRESTIGDTSEPVTTTPHPPYPATAPGSTSPAFTGIDSADALVDALRADEILAVPAVDLDPSALTNVDQDPLFTGQLRQGEDILSIASPRSVISRSVWLADRPLSAAAVVMLRNLGFRMVMMTDDVAGGLGVSTDDPTPATFGLDFGGGSALPAMMFSPLGAQLQTPLANESTTGTPNDAAVRLLVELQLSRSDVPAVVLATPRMTVPDPAITAQFVALAEESPDVVVVPVSRLPGLVDGALARSDAAPLTLPNEAGTDLTARLAMVTAARDRAADAASMLVESTRATEWTAELDRAMSSGIDDVTARQHVDAITAEVDAVIGAIVEPEPFTFRLTGSSSTLRIRVQNTSAEALDIAVVVRSFKLRFPEQPPVVRIPAGGTEEIPVDVEARSNGTFTVEVDIAAPNGALLTDPVVLTARVARVTGLSQVMSGGAVLVLVSWWYSHFRRRNGVPRPRRP